MKNRKLLRPALCLLLALLAGCGPSREGPMEPEAESRALLSSGDLRGLNLLLVRAQMACARSI